MSEKIPVPGKMKCPMCGYALLGLPESHTCPECGFEYDPYCEVIRLGGRSRDFANALGGLVILALILWPRPPIREVLPCAVWLALLVIVWGWRWFKNWGNPRLLIINRNGIRLQHPNAEQHIFWADFDRAYVCWTGSFIIKGRDSRTLLKSRYVGYGSWFLMRSAAEKMNRLAQVYASMECK
jgi:hypothetical protein